MGCAGMAHHRRPLEEELGIPMIDPTQAAVTMALGRSSSAAPDPIRWRAARLLRGARRPAVISRLRRQNNPGLAGDAAVVLDATVALEVEDGLLAESGGIEIAAGDD